MRTRRPRPPSMARSSSGCSRPPVLLHCSRQGGPPVVLPHQAAYVVMPLSETAGVGRSPGGFCYIAADAHCRELRWPGRSPAPSRG